MPDPIFRDYGPWLVVAFESHTLTDPLRLNQIRAAVQERLKLIEGRPNVLMSFKDVETVSSQIIGLMLETKQAVEKRKGTLVLSHLGRNIKQVLALTRLDKQFTEVSATELLAPYKTKVPGRTGDTKTSIDWLD